MDCLDGEIGEVTDSQFKYILISYQNQSKILIFHGSNAINRSLTDDENIPLPYGLESVWFDKVKEKLAGQLPEDKTDDNRQTPE